MNIANIINADFANGLGVRISVFVSGCKNHCEGCFNPDTWDFNYGVPYTEEIKNNILEELSKDYYSGITILGGEPFELENQKDVWDLISFLKDKLPDKNIWMYTGYLYDEDLITGGKRHSLYTDKILNSIDILIDGKFELDKRDITLKFKGSSNQRIIDVKESIKSGKIVLSDLN